MRKIFLGSGGYLKKLSLTTLLLSSLLSLHSCHSQHEKKTNNNTLSLFMQDDPLSFDPRAVRLISNVTLSKHLFEGLLRESTNEEIELALADAYTVSKDLTCYTFSLKQTTWSNGDPVTSLDFKDSWEQVILGKVPSVFHYAFMDIVNAKEAFNGETSQQEIGIYCPDPQTLIVHLNKPVPYFLKLLTLPAFFPVHKVWREQAGLTNPLPKTPLISNGPFLIKKRRAKQYLQLVKNPLYHEAHQVKLSGIHIQIIPDIHTASLLFENGKLDWQGPPWSDSLPLEISKRLAQQGKLQKFDVAGTSWLIFNIQKYPFNNQKLRKSLSLAIDRKLLLNTILNGRGLTTFDILPPCLLSSNIANESPSTDDKHSEQQKEAQRLFKEALHELHLSKEEFHKIPLLFPVTSPITPLIVQAIRQQWKEVLDIHVPLQGLEVSILQETKQLGSFSLTIGDWMADFRDPMAFLSIFSSPFGVHPYMINNPSFTSLISKIQEEKQPKKRQELIQQATALLEKESCVVPLYHHSFEFTLNKRLANLKLSSLGTVDFKHSELEHSKEWSQK